MCEESKWKEVTLYTASYDDVTLDGALEKLNKIDGLASDKLILLVYTPSFCGFARWSEGQIVALKAGCDVQNIFELRAFCEDCELRWVRENDCEKGRAVLTSEKEFESSKEKSKKFLSLSGEYILWGKKKTGSMPSIEENGIIELFEHRIGKLPVPLAKIGSEERVCLCYTEYFSADEYGNLNWEAERLAGLN